MLRASCPRRVPRGRRRGSLVGPAAGSACAPRSCPLCASDTSHWGPLHGHHLAAPSRGHHASSRAPARSRPMAVARALAPRNVRWLFSDAAVQAVFISQSVAALWARQRGCGRRTQLPQSVFRDGGIVAPAMHDAPTRLNAWAPPPQRARTKPAPSAPSSPNAQCGIHLATPNLLTTSLTNPSAASIL